MKKGLLTLLAGYAAGLAIAMKYRKDHQASVTPSSADPTVPPQPPKSKMDEFIDEVVDIHKVAYSDIRDAVVVTFEEIKDFEELKKKVQEFVESFQSEFDAKVTGIMNGGNAKIEEIQKMLEDFYTKKQDLLKNAGEKARSLSNISQDAIDLLLGEARKKLSESYEKVKEELNKGMD